MQKLEIKYLLPSWVWDPFRLIYAVRIFHTCGRVIGVGRIKDIQANSKKKKKKTLELLKSPLQFRGEGTSVGVAAPDI